MEGHSVVSADVLASYASDAACEIPGVHGVVDGQLHRHGEARIVQDDGLTVGVGAAVQEHVSEYLARTAGVTQWAVDVVVAEIAPSAT